MLGKVTLKHAITTAGQLGVFHAGQPGARCSLLLLHGRGTDSSSVSWHHLLDPLSEFADVRALDLPGFGQSVDIRPVGGPRAMAEVVAEALDDLGAGPAVIIGVSMGGDVALNLALDSPQHVAGLVLIAPGGLVPVFRNPALQYVAWLTARSPEWVMHPVSRFANRFARTTLRFMVENVAAVPEEVVVRLGQESKHPQAGRAYLRYNRAVIGRRRMLNDLSARVRAISVPTLFLHGKKDRLVDPEGSVRASRIMPAADLRLIADCGHWAQIERPDVFLSETQGFLACHGLLAGPASDPNGG